MKKNKKGFTLIELLAVIVILAIIVVLAFTKIKGFLKKSDKSAAETNAKIFIKGVNDMASLSVRDEVRYKSGFYLVNELIESGNLKVNGTLPTDGYVELVKYEVTNACLEINDYKVTFENGTLKDTKLGETCTYDVEPVEYAYTGGYETYRVSAPGNYKVQLWGASGGYALCNGSICGTPGNGGYAEGVINLKYGDVLYVYVGQKGTDAVLQDIASATFNGGGLGTWDYGDNEAAGAGGGSTDVRLVSGDWNNAESLASRIIVAGGGGGTSWGATSGYGGGISGGDGNSATNAPGATQTTGYTFGIGKDGEGAGDSDGVAGGGGGYWGGISYNSGAGEAASGGSGYISGHTGCVAIKSASDTSPKSGCSDGTTDNTCSIHYSNKKFTNTVLTAGNGSMPSHEGDGTITGNTGNGYAIITYLGK